MRSLQTPGIKNSTSVDFTAILFSRNRAMNALYPLAKQHTKVTQLQQKMHFSLRHSWVSHNLALTLSTHHANNLSYIFSSYFIFNCWACTRIYIYVSQIQYLLQAHMYCTIACNRLVRAVNKKQLRERH